MLLKWANLSRAMVNGVRTKVEFQMMQTAGSAIDFELQQSEDLFAVQVQLGLRLGRNLQRHVLKGTRDDISVP